MVTWERANGGKVKIPKAMDASFAELQDDGAREIRAAIDRFNAEQTTVLERELFKQRTRLADAERTLQTKITKAATESKRIASDKIEATIRRLDDLRRTDLKDRDSRIFPGMYALVMVMEEGQRVIKPMRYQCRLAGKPKSCPAAAISSGGSSVDRRESDIAVRRVIKGHGRAVAF
jgi:hypothetical protein